MRKLYIALGHLQIAALALGFLAIAEPVAASHFRYGQLSWQRIGGPGSLMVRFDLFAAFRRDGYSGTAPDGRPQIGDIITETIGATGLNFGNGSSTGTLRFVVLNIDPANNWLYGAALQPGTNTQGILHTYSGSGPWSANIDSCCRIGNSLNASNGAYRVESIVDLNDTASSPTSTLPIIVQCPQLQACNFPVPAADPDAQLLQFRLATNAESAMAPLNGLTVTSNGLASFQTPNSPIGSLYSAQIVIEKRDRLNPANLLTKVAVDFLIQVVAGGPVSGQNPSFQSPTPTCGQTINLQVGQPLQFTVSARSNNPGGSVTLNAVGQPGGSTFTPVLPVAGSPAVNAVFNFTPSAAQGGQVFQMNMLATDEGGRQTTCGFAIQVIAPNTVVRLNATRSSSRLRMQWLISGSVCSTPTYRVFKSVGGGTFTPIATTAATALQDTLIGPAGTINQYYVEMSFADNCAAPTQSNVVSVVF